MEVGKFRLTADLIAASYKLHGTRRNPGAQDHQSRELLSANFAGSRSATAISPLIAQQRPTAKLLADTICRNMFLAHDHSLFKGNEHHIEGRIGNRKRPFWSYINSLLVVLLCFFPSARRLPDNSLCSNRGRQFASVNASWQSRIPPKTIAPPLTSFRARVINGRNLRVKEFTQTAVPPNSGQMMTPDEKACRGVMSPASFQKYLRSTVHGAPQVPEAWA